MGHPCDSDANALPFDHPVSGGEQQAHAAVYPLQPEPGRLCRAVKEQLRGSLKLLQPETRPAVLPHAHLPFAPCLDALESNPTALAMQDLLVPSAAFIDTTSHSEPAMCEPGVRPPAHDLAGKRL